MARVTGLSQAALVKAGDEAPAEQGPWAGIPALGLQQLWFQLQRREWFSLALIPADEETSALDFARPLYEVGRLALGERLRLIDAREVELSRTAELILDITGAAATRSGERVLVTVQSVLSNPAGVPLALAADAALLCVELGKSSLGGVHQTVEIVGPARFIGCITLPPP
jgi:hypothetical protein